MFCCKLYKVISKLLISAIFVFTSLIKVSADFPKPYKFDNNKMEVCIESNQITIRDRENSDIVYGIPVKFKNLNNGIVEYEFNICIDNKFWVGNCNLPYVEQGQNKEINGFEVKIRNGNLKKKLMIKKLSSYNNLMNDYYQYGDIFCNYNNAEYNFFWCRDTCGPYMEKETIVMKKKIPHHISIISYNFNCSTVNLQAFVAISIFILLNQ